MVPEFTALSRVISASSPSTQLTRCRREERTPSSDAVSGPQPSNRRQCSVTPGPPRRSDECEGTATCSRPVSSTHRPRAERADPQVSTPPSDTARRSSSDTDGRANQPRRSRRTAPSRTAPCNVRTDTPDAANCAVVATPCCSRSTCHNRSITPRWPPTGRANAPKPSSATLRGLSGAVEEAPMFATEVQTRREGRKPLQRPTQPRLRTRSGEGVDRRTGADEVAVAVGLVDPANWRPVFPAHERADRVDGLLTGIRVRPLLGHQALGRVRGAA